MKKLLIATSNPGKIREIKNILKNIPFTVLTMTDLKLDIDVPETGKTFKENAGLKAKTIGKKTQLLTLAEDSGLEVDALEGRPGIHSARYAKGTDYDRVLKLLRELKGFKREERTARYKAVVVLYDPKTGKVQNFEGKTEGLITEKPQGKNGFGYDPVFYSLELKKTFGEADDEEKNKVSHRGRVCKEIFSYLKV